jgi:hypothetical protein
MSLVLPRPAPAFDPDQGLLHAEHFQMAYVTNDIDATCDLFGRQLGIREFARLEGPTAEGGHIRAEFAWVGSIMYELIEASGPGSEIFTSRLPPGDGFVLQHHHLGFLIASREQWDGVLANAERNGWAVPHGGVNPLVEFCFVEVPGLPHYLEYLFATPAGLDFFASVPRT